MFENVTYDFYSDTLGRAEIPDVETFERFKLMNVQKMKCLLPYVEEREENGIDSAVCMMIEVDYRSEKTMNQESSVASESVSGHSISFDNAAKNKEVELNAKSIEEKKIEAIRLFCYLNVGVC